MSLLRHRTQIFRLLQINTEAIADQTIIKKTKNLGLYSLLNYLCMMKKATKHILQSFTLFSTLLFFVLYSNGLSFSLHYCDACKQTKVFFINHPNCCAESQQIHKSEQECNCHSECSDHGDNHHGESICSAKHHCKTTHKFIRIYAPYVSGSTPSSQAICVDTFKPILPIETSDMKLHYSFIHAPSSPPMVIQAGGALFLSYISQHLFYS